MFDLRIENGTVVTPEKSERTNIYVLDGKIAQLTEEVLDAKEVIDASGKLIFPGFIDPHVHSRDGGATHKEDFFHSTRAAAVGGLTSLIEMPNAVPAVTDAERFKAQKANLESKAYIDFAMWALCLGRLNNDDLQELDELGVADRGYVLKNGENVMSDTGANLLNNDAIRAAYLGENVYKENK